VRKILDLDVMDEKKKKRIQVRDSNKNLIREIMNLWFYSTWIMDGKMVGL